MPSKRVRIQDVAREAGVSVTTVSRFLNERYESMSSETRAKIGEVIQSLNYQPNAFAQGLKGNRSKIVAVIAVNIGYPFCVALIRSLSAILTPAGYNLVVCETGGDEERESEILKSMISLQVDAIVAQTNGQNNKQYGQIAQKLPVALVDRQFSLPHVVNVLTNNEEASFELAKQLFAQGYSSILYVTEETQGISTRTDRLNGYLAACRAQNREPLIGWVTRGDAASFQALQNLLQNQNDSGPIAVYTANALLLHEIYPALRELPMQIPTELGIATFDEPDWVNLVSPSLTCVRQPVQAIGKWTANHLLNCLKEKKLPSKKTQIFKSELVPGESTRLLVELN